MAVHSNTHRLGVIGLGHNGPRKRAGRRETKTTSTALLIIRDRLSYIGDAWNYDMGREVGIDNARFLSLRNHLERNRAVLLEYRGRRLYWVLLDPDLVNYDSVVVNLAIEPRWSKSNTKQGHQQIDCTLCGLQTKPWAPEDRAQAWREHLGSVCHR